MSKTLVTHINPHLDDIAAIWLIKKFFKGFEDATIEFISQSQTDKVSGQESEDKIFLGTGKGRFDEHKGDLEESAMSLVWNEIKKTGLSPVDEIEVKALDEMAKINTLYDRGKVPAGDFDEFSLESFIRSFKNTPEDSLKTVNLGCEILDRILPQMKRRQKMLRDFDKRVEFDTKWGKGMAIESEAFNKSFGYKHGFDIVIQKGTTSGNVGITTPGYKDNDISEIYHKLKEIDQADWFLHHSNKMVLCGAGSAPDAKKTKLSLPELIDLVKSL